MRGIFWYKSPFSPKLAIDIYEKSCAKRKRNEFCLAKLIQAQSIPEICKSRGACFFGPRANDFSSKSAHSKCTIIKRKIGHRFILCLILLQKFSLCVVYFSYASFLYKSSWGAGILSRTPAYPRIINCFLHLAALYFQLFYVLFDNAPL